MSERSFLETWRRSLDHRLHRAEWLVEMGWPDEHFEDLRKEVAAFGEVVNYLKTQAAEQTDEKPVVLPQPHRQSA